MNHDLSVLVAARLAAKAEEDAAVMRRREIDAEIVKVVAGPDDGTVTERVGSHKVVVTRGVTRKVDTAALQNHYGELSENAQKCFRWKAEIETKLFKAVMELGGDTLRQVQQFVTTTPSTPTVKLEEIKE